MLTRVQQRISAAHLQPAGPELPKLRDACPQLHLPPIRPAGAATPNVASATAVGASMLPLQSSLRHSCLLLQLLP